MPQVSFCSLSGKQEFVSSIRQKALGLLEKKTRKISKSHPLDLCSLSISCKATHAGPYIGEIVENVGMATVGFAIADTCIEKSSEICEYFCCILSDGRCYEAYTTNANREANMFGGSFYSESLVTWNSLKVVREGKPDLPIHIARHDTPLDFFKAVAKLFTLFPFWAKKKWIVCNDLVIPEHAPKLSDENEISYYFLLNLLFRILFFDIGFSYSE